MNPQVKKIASAAGFTLVSVLLVGAERVLVPSTPPYLQGLLGALFAGIAHYVDAWGHTDRVEAAVKAAQQ